MNNFDELGIAVFKLGYIVDSLFNIIFDFTYNILEMFCMKRE